ncbi:MOSC domain-containing protein [Roseomonas marmotae]|uniref:MOSC domain-containing protein n=1 Tax=Roseomonas marmotae TaxID=2768161 RepID=A0ABS3KJG9_9PROT|nr:MOSC N-terminal beta barrel domain-containing protein [Roseomonas marmotae]MBO1076758.1 MOSC domain-containing protein [Roseomonas marmotae]QTI78000.1 MOSC domain-containing protein [Roseomonas marmotae]
MRVETLYRYPVKGLTAEALEDVLLKAGECIQDDRRFALAQGDAPFDEAAPGFLPKRHFACLMVNERLALISAAYDGHSGQLLLRIPGGQELLASTQTPTGRNAIAAALTAYLGEEARGTPRFVSAPGHAFSDDRRKGVTLINLATIAALEKATGLTLDPLRFRANIYFSGLPAWAEFDWVDKEVLIGGARLSIYKRTMRCPATQVNPVTAERDANVPKLLREHFGHADLGLHALVLEDGRVSRGDALEVLP